MRKKSVRKVQQPLPPSSPASQADNSSVFSVLTGLIGRAPFPIRLSIGILALGFVIFGILPDSSKEKMLAKISFDKPQPAQADNPKPQKDTDVAVDTSRVAKDEKPVPSNPEPYKSVKNSDLLAHNGNVLRLPPTTNQPVGRPIEELSPTQPIEKASDDDDEEEEIVNTPTPSIGKPPTITKPAPKATVSEINCADFKGARFGKDYIPEKCQGL